MCVTKLHGKGQKGFCLFCEMLSGFHLKAKFLKQSQQVLL